MNPPQQAWGSYTDSLGNVGPPGSAAATCQAPKSGIYNFSGSSYVTLPPNSNGACFLNASSPACAACAAAANLAAGQAYLSPLVRGRGG